MYQIEMPNQLGMPQSCQGAENLIRQLANREISSTAIAGLLAHRNVRFVDTIIAFSLIAFGFISHVLPQAKITMNSQFHTAVSRS